MSGAAARFNIQNLLFGVRFPSAATLMTSTSGTGGARIPDAVLPCLLGDLH